RESGADQGPTGRDLLYGRGAQHDRPLPVPRGPEGRDQAQGEAAAEAPAGGRREGVVVRGLDRPAQDQRSAAVRLRLGGLSFALGLAVFLSIPAGALPALPAAASSGGDGKRSVPI